MLTAPVLTGDPPDNVYHLRPPTAPIPDAAPAAAERTATPRAPIMHDAPTPEAANYDAADAAAEFDRVVRENLDVGVNTALVQNLVLFLRDPRPEARHRQIMAEIVNAINGRTGVAFPGNAHLIASVICWANGERQNYAASTIKSTLSDLIGWGYLHSTRRAPPSGSRAIAHYTVGRPRDLEAAIEAHVLKERGKVAAKKPEVQAGINLSNGVDPEVKVHARVNLSQPEVYAGIPAEVYAGVSRADKELEEEPVVGAALPLPLGEMLEQKVPSAGGHSGSGKRSKRAKPTVPGSDRSSRIEAARAIYNAEAKARGWAQWLSGREYKVEQALDRLARAARSVGHDDPDGLEAWGIAVGTVVQWKWIKDGIAIDFLLRTQGTLGDVACRLFEEGLTKAQAPVGPRDTNTDFYDQLLQAQDGSD